MSWLERCYQTYEYIRRVEPDLIGRQEPNRATLLPVGHTTQQAQIQVELDLDGNFLNAFVLRKKNKEKGPKRRMNKPRSSPAQNAHPPELPALCLTHLPTNFNILLPIIPITVGERSPAGRNITNSFSAGVLPHFPTHWSALYFTTSKKAA